MRSRPRHPAHQLTSAHLQAAYPFMGEGGLGGRGVYIGRDVYSGASFCFDPWVLYEPGRAHRALGPGRRAGWPRQVGAGEDLPRTPGALRPAGGRDRSEGRVRAAALSGSGAGRFAWSPVAKSGSTRSMPPVGVRGAGCAAWSACRRVAAEASGAPGAHGPRSWPTGRRPRVARRPSAVQHHLLHPAAEAATSIAVGAEDLATYGARRLRPRTAPPLRGRPARDVRRPDQRGRRARCADRGARPVGPAWLARHGGADGLRERVAVGAPRAR